MSETAYVEVTKDQAIALIERGGYEGNTNAMMGGTFWYEPGSPTGYPYVRVAWTPEQGRGWENAKGEPLPIMPERWSAARELLGES